MPRQAPSRGSFLEIDHFVMASTSFDHLVGGNNE
jgi:hypothetical protein